MDIAGTSLDPLLLWRQRQDPKLALDVGSSMLATMVRGGSGTVVGHLGPRPERTLVLYEKEACPFSRLAREALSILDLDADMVPCPEGAHEHLAELERVGGDSQLPFLLDPNTGRQLYESGAIVAYLFETYGDGSRAPQLASMALAKRSSKLASRIRKERGNVKEASRPCEQRLELYGYEGSPYTRLVRERLSAYALPWTSCTRARNSPRRESFEREHGRTQFPFLRDPNTGAELFESRAICEYLTRTYGR